MKLTLVVPLVIVVLFAFVLCCPSHLIGKEKKITRNNLPTAVIKSFEQAYPGASIKGLSEEVEHKTTYYEIESMDGKTRRDILYTKEGKAYEVEETIPADSLPSALSTSLKTDYPKSKIVRAEKVTRDSKVGYEITITVGKKTRELSFDAAGALIQPKHQAKGKTRDDDEEEED